MSILKACLSTPALLLAAWLFPAPAQSAGDVPPASPAAAAIEAPLVTGAIPDRVTGAIPDRAVVESTAALAGKAAQERASLRHMIGQMLMIGFPGASPGEEWPALAIRMIDEGRIGGVLLLGGNVQSPAQLKRLTGALRKAGGPVRPFIAVDQEGGRVQRLTPQDGFLGLPSAAEMARDHDPTSALELYRREARELAECGITVNFGPVVDLAVNPDNPVIARLDRSYGATTKRVLPFAKAFIEAYGDAGIMTAAKHFPGHGSSTTDPHEARTDVNGLWRAQELGPFKALIARRQVPMIMVGHLILDGYSDDGDVPASLSRRAVTARLRKALDFNGLIVTDDLDMNAVRGRYSMEEAFVRAVAAGNDVIVHANNREPDRTLVDRVTDAIAAAVESGRIPRSRIRQAYDRILVAKGGLAETRMANSD